MLGSAPLASHRLRNGSYVRSLASSGAAGVMVALLVACWLRLPRCTRSPSHGLTRLRHLQRGGGTHRGKGRLQVQIRRAFLGHPLRSTSEIYDWCYARDRSRTRSEAMRWSVHRILRDVADAVGHSRGPGRPWLWRLETPAAERHPRRKIDII